MGKFALLIGISEYAEGLPALPAATQDILAIQRVLDDPSLGNFDEVQVLPNPTRDQMATTIEVWLAARQSEDLVVLFFSGHGVKDDRRDLYFASGNTRKIDNKLMRSTALAARELQGFLRDSRPRQQIVILDCCFSGAFGELIARDDGEIELEAQLAAEGRVVMTSTSAVDYAFEDKTSELSVYTRYLVEGIEKGTADLDGDGFITVDELHKFASRKVRETAPAMVPDMIMLQGQGHDIRLTKAPQDRPELRYRKEVEKRSRNGSINIIGRRLLQSLQRDCRLSDEAAAAIEAEVLKPFRDYQHKLNEYREVLADCLQGGAALDRYHLIDLKDYQKELGLKDSDVRPIQQDLVGRALVLESVTAPTLATSSAASVQQYLTFSFETVRVNEEGKVIETIPGTANVFTEDLGNGITLGMVRIPGGKFLMGAAKGEDGASDDKYLLTTEFWIGAAKGEAGASKDEYPQHKVTVPEFWMGRHAVTQAQWQAVAALSKVERDLVGDPAHFEGAQRPVEQVSWDEAMEFCQRLSKKSQWAYRLPSEAQWEYACRAGTTTPFYFGPTMTTDLANYDGKSTYGKAAKGNYRKQTTDVGSFKPNSFGLYDVHGNVWEWCLDGWHDSYKRAPTNGSGWKSSDERKVLRGGSWDNQPTSCRAANRNWSTCVVRNYGIGFRVIAIAPRT
ncbi:MAG: sulfatase-modifying factor protein [Phormidesmis priestleyi]|uniref:Sulfatase-modifying factor protein n=1 Tax=Phormidesmis priestleyi TaxID=268141 RepID=A0A2W4WSV3_9CYAN|nr:MAG: sulfatase-modifying factor protein [Phormidesmis priestleyi]